MNLSDAVALCSLLIVACGCRPVMDHRIDSRPSVKVNLAKPVNEGSGWTWETRKTGTLSDTTAIEHECDLTVVFPGLQVWKGQSRLTLIEKCHNRCGSSNVCMVNCTPPNQELTFLAAISAARRSLQDLNIKDADPSYQKLRNYESRASSAGDYSISVGANVESNCRVYIEIRPSLITQRDGNSETNVEDGRWYLTYEFSYLCE